MNTYKYKGLGIMMLLLVSVSCWLLFKGCSSGGGGGGGTAQSKHMVIPLEGPLSHFQVHSNQTSTFTYTYQLNTDAPLYDSFKIDRATLSHVTITAGIVPAPSMHRSSSSLASAVSNTAEVFFRIGGNSDTVCTTGNPYGPYTLTLDALAQIVDVTPAHVPSNSATIDIINRGSIAMCVVITSPIDATFSIDGAEVNVTERPCGTPANFAGLWSSTYQCGNSCVGTPENGTFQLTVTQDGTTASYTDDSNATFTGKICGNVFRFERIQQQEIERGTMTINPDGSATKQSTWRTTTDPICGGDCIDILTRL